MTYATYDPSFKPANFTFSGGDLTVVRASYTGFTGLTRSLYSKSSGKWYWEVTCTAVSIATLIGVGNSTETTSDAPGYSNNSIAWTNLLSGAIIKNTSSIASPGTFANGDIVAIAYDADAGVVYFYKNNSLAATISGASVPAGALYAMLGDSANNTANTTTTNFGATAFTYTPPAGFVGLQDVVSTTSVATLQRITAVGVATQNFVGLSAATRERITATSSGTSVTYGYSASVLRGLTAAGQASSSPIPELPLITGSGTAVTGVVTSFNLPQDLPYPIAHGVVNPTSHSDSDLPGITAVGVAISGALGVSVKALESYTAAGYGGGAAVGRSSAVLPGVQAAGIAYLGTGATFSAVVIHTEMQGVSTYTNFVFNSLARFNGQSLAAGDAGIFLLGGDKDDGVNIDARIATGITDFGTLYLKRLERAYLGYRTAGQLVLRVTTDESNIRDYLVPGNGLGGLHGAHVRLGRGVEAQYWQFEILNRDGCDFSLNMIEVKPVKLSRRVGARGA